MTSHLASLGSFSRRFLAPLALLGLGVSSPACDGGDETGRVSFGLEGGASFFRLRIFKSVPGANLEGPVLFDTGCIPQQSTTYELSNIPVGNGYAVVYEGFSAAACPPSGRAALGFRGAVAIIKGEQPYYHVQVFPTAGVATFPEDINLSAANARAIDFCAADADCGAARNVCYDDAAPAYWCVPSCASTVDCLTLHPRATCDTVAGWCMLETPFPLNLSEPRALGAAATLSSGDVVVFGGLEREGAISAGATASFVTTSFPLERFDAKTGLFTELSVVGLSSSPGGSFGFAALGGDRFVAVGGLLRAQMGYSAAGVLDVSANWSQDLSAQIHVWDFATGRGKASTLSQGIARSTVVPLSASSFLVVGGIAAQGNGVEVRKSTHRCEIAEDLSVSCQAGPGLDTPRQSPAASCLDAACNRVLILGGNSGGKLAEVVDLTENKATALSTKGLPERLLGPVLCGLDLVAGSLELSKPNPSIASRLTLRGTELEGNPLVGAPATSYLVAAANVSPVFGAGAECHLAGGLGSTGSSKAIIRTGAARFDVRSATLGRARFGAAAAVIGAGPLAGRVMFVGGLALPGEPGTPGAGGLQVVRGVEVYSP